MAKQTHHPGKPAKAGPRISGWEPIFLLQQEVELGAELTGISDFGGCWWQNFIYLFFSFMKKKPLDLSDLSKHSLPQRKRLF